MSKAVTNDEVEDVLSSIRRLVSEDKRPLADLSGKSLTRTSEAGSKKPVADRFVLTPALRVAEPAKKGEEEGPLDLGSVARETWAPSDDGEGGRPVMRSSGDASGDIDALVHDALSIDDDDSLSDGDYGAESYWDDDEDDSFDKRDAKTTDEGGAQKVKDQSSEFGDEADWNDAAATDNADDTQWNVEEALGEFDMGADELHFRKEPLVKAEPETDPEPEPVEPDASLLTADVPLRAKIAALGAAIGKSPDEWEPDGDEASDLSATETPAMAWEDDVELDAKGSPLPTDPSDDQPEAQDAEPEAPAKPDIGAAFSGDDQVMDEEALRDLVSEIVRAELQGALGERITRNVRKLVRREIHRALTAQELE